MYHHASYVGGALRLCQTENWTRSNKFDPKALEIILTHPSYDAYWQSNDSTLKFPVMNVPAVHYGGWFDTFQQGTIDSFVGRQHHGAAGAKGRQKLILGPWHHGGADRNGLVGELRFPSQGAPEQYSNLRWFDYHLKGIDNGIMDQPAVAYYVMGDTSDPKAPGNQWRTAPDWPVPANDTPYYLAAGGRLSTGKPAAAPATRFVQYTFDPADPCPTIGGRNLTIPRGPKNQNSIESRPDVLLFTTPPLDEPVEVTGRVLARLFVSSSAADTDLSIRLCDVYPDGKSYLFTDGMLRLRYRNSLEKPEPLVPGAVVPVTVDCWSTSIVFNRGHRIRIAVTSSNYPRFDVNPGTGKPWSDDGAKVKQSNRIYCDAAHPSCIELPVVAVTASKSRSWSGSHSSRFASAMHRISGTRLRKTPNRMGSKCVPRPRSMIARASTSGRAAR
jgi:putative CocE/NonD family hydrolase